MSNYFDNYDDVGIMYYVRIILYINKNAVADVQYKRWVSIVCVYVCKRKILINPVYCTDCNNC